MRLPPLGAGQVAGLLLAVSLALAGLQAWTLAQCLRLEQAARNTQAAQSLAATLWQPGSDARTLLQRADAHFAQGQDLRVTVGTADGRVLVRLQRQPAIAGVPDWWTQAWPLSAPPGRITQAAYRDLPAVLEVEANPVWAQQLLWQTLSRSAMLLAWVVAAGLLAAAAWRSGLLPGRRQPAGLAALDAQGLPALRSLAHQLEATVRGLRRDLALQAQQVLRLQRQARTDTLTGVSLRHHFLGRLQGRLSALPAGRTALLIVRLCDLEAVNQRAGHAATDGLLRAVGQVLLTYVDRVAGAAAGRLNGSDFALCLPVGGVALETALSLHEALSALPALRSAGALALVGGVDELPAITCSAALAEADAALARAEAGSDLEGPGVAVDRHGALVADAAGASAWREQIALALSQGRASLAEVPVRSREGELLRLRCTLHLQLTPAAAHQPPRSWLALARRARLLPHVDLLSLQLALQAIAADGLPRSVQVGVAAWTAPGFVAAVKALLQARPAQARALSIELAAAEQRGEHEALAAAVACWLPLGASLGVAHGVILPAELTGLQAAGMSFVTLSGEQLRGVAGDAALQAYAQGLIRWSRDLGLSVRVDRVADPADLDTLWPLGLDGASAASLARP